MISSMDDSTLLLFWLGVTLPVVVLTLADTLVEALPSRAELLRRLALTRMPQMMDRLDIEVAAYLRGVPRREIERDIRVCEFCAQRATCRAVLKDSGHTDFSFCPTADSWRRFALVTEQ